MRGLSLIWALASRDLCRVPALSCYKTEMPKIIERWLLFRYVDGEFTPLSKPSRNERSAGEGAFETPGARAAVGCGGRDSDQEVTHEGSGQNDFTGGMLYRQLQTNS